MTENARRGDRGQRVSFPQNAKISVASGQSRRNRGKRKRKKKKKLKYRPMRPMHPTTMIITSCSFHGIAHDHPKISVCNGISSFLSPVAIRRTFLRCFSSAFRPSGIGTGSHWLSLDDRARVVAYFDIARSKNHLFDRRNENGPLTFIIDRSTGFFGSSLFLITCRTQDSLLFLYAN